MDEALDKRFPSARTLVSEHDTAHTMFSERTVSFHQNAFCIPSSKKLLRFLSLGSRSHFIGLLYKLLGFRRQRRSVQFRVRVLETPLMPHIEEVASGRSREQRRNMEDR